MPTLLFRARCHLILPNYRIVKSQFDIEPDFKEIFGEYAVFNLMRERGKLEDNRRYRITIDPLFPH